MALTTKHGYTKGRIIEDNSQEFSNYFRSFRGWIIYIIYHLCSFIRVGMGFGRFHAFSIFIFWYRFTSFNLSAISHVLGQSIFMFVFTASLITLCCGLFLTTFLFFFVVHATRKVRVKQGHVNIFLPLPLQCWDYAITLALFHLILSIIGQCALIRTPLTQL